MVYGELEAEEEGWIVGVTEETKGNNRDRRLTRIFARNLRPLEEDLVSPLGPSLYDSTLTHICSIYVCVPGMHFCPTIGKLVILIFMVLVLVSADDRCSRRKSLRTQLRDGWLIGCVGCIGRSLGQAGRR